MISSHKCEGFAFEQNWHRELQDSFRHTYRVCISIVIPDEIYSELLVVSQIAYVVVFYVSMLATPTIGISCSDIHTDHRIMIVSIIHGVYMITYFVFPSPWIDNTFTGMTNWYGIAISRARPLLSCSAFLWFVWLWLPIWLPCIPCKWSYCAAFPRCGWSFMCHPFKPSGKYKWWWAFKSHRMDPFKAHVQRDSVSQFALWKVPLLLFQKVNALTCIALANFRGVVCRNITEMGLNVVCSQKRAYTTVARLSGAEYTIVWSVKSAHVFPYHVINILCLCTSLPIDTGSVDLKLHIF